MPKKMPSRSFNVMENNHPKARVLVVDDDLLIRQCVTDILKHRHYEVDSLPNGIQLEAVLEQDPPDLIVLDIKLPWKDGFELCKSIKANERWRTIPVLFLTGKRTDEDFAEGIQTGCDGYLTKPFTVKDLTEKISELLKLSGV